MIYIYKSLIQTSTLKTVGNIFLSSNKAYLSTKPALAFKTHLLKPSNLTWIRQFGFKASNRAPNEADKLKKIQVSEIRRLMSLAKPHKLRLAMAIGLLLVSSAVSMTVPFFIGKLIDFIQTGDKESMKEKLKNISLIMLGVFFVGAAANFGRIYLIQSTGEKIIMRLRQDLFKSTMDQEMAFFDRNKTGELINRLSSDAELVGRSMSQNLR